MIRDDVFFFFFFSIFSWVVRTENITFVFIFKFLWLNVDGALLVGHEKPHFH